MAKEMTMLEHLEELRNRTIKIFATVAVISMIAFSFGIRKIDLGEQSLLILLPGDPRESLSFQFINSIRAGVVPDYVRIIVTTPTQAIMAGLYMSIFLGVLLGMPVIVYEVAAFINPALYPYEKKLALKLLIPATLLFISGCIFSYLYVTPFAFDFLYRFAQGFGPTALTTVEIDVMISFVLLFTFAFGVAFQLPIVMYLLTAVEVVDVSFWRRNFRYSLLAIIIFGAIITPDGSGVTMFMVAAPMTILYGAGYLFIRRRAKNTSGEKDTSAAA